MKVVRSMLGWWCLLLGALAAALALASRGADKILYLDAERSVVMTEMEVTVYEFRRARGINTASTGPYEATSRELMVMASNGSLLVRTFEYGRPRTPGTTNGTQTSGKVLVGKMREALKAFAQATYQSPRLMNIRHFEFPLVWVSIALFAFGTLLLATPPLRQAVRRAVRRSQNRCVFCGYSLRGLISDRCPECGNPFVRQEAV